MAVQTAAPGLRWPARLWVGGFRSDSRRPQFGRLEAEAGGNRRLVAGEHTPRWAITCSRTSDGAAKPYAATSNSLWQPGYQTQSHEISHLAIAPMGHSCRFCRTGVHSVDLQHKKRRAGCPPLRFDLQKIKASLRLSSSEPP